MSLHAFTDESKERGFRFVTTVVAARDVSVARADMREWLIGKRERYHAKNETPDTNKRHLRELVERGHQLSFVVVEHLETRPPRLAREASLARLALWIVENDVSRWVLERDAPAERSDRRILSETQRANPGASFEYLHAAPSSEPLLWASDLVAWSLNRGGVHARIARDLIGESIDAG